MLGSAARFLRALLWVVRPSVSGTPRYECSYLVVIHSAMSPSNGKEKPLLPLLCLFVLLFSFINRVVDRAQSLGSLASSSFNYRDFSFIGDSRNRPYTST